MVTPRVLKVLVTLVIVLVAVWVVYQGVTVWGRRSGLFPLVIGIPVLVLALAQLTIDTRALARGSRPEGRTTASGADAAQPRNDDEVSADAAKARTIAIIITILGFVAAIWLLGFVIAVPLVTFLYLKVAARERWRLSVGLSAAAGLMFYLVFVKALGVPAPFGVLLGLLIE